MLAEAAPADRPNVQQQFERLTRTPQGCYGLIDYVNFKGEVFSTRNVIKARDGACFKFSKRCTALLTLMPLMNLHAQRRLR